MSDIKHAEPQNLPLFAAAVAAIGLATFFAIALTGSMHSGAQGTYQIPPLALAVHLLTAIPAIPLGAYILWTTKGNARHKLLGRIWATMMVATAISSYWLRGAMGGVGPIHIFSVVTLVSIPAAVFAIRRGNVRGHRRSMTGPYIGLIMAGLFAFAPARTLGHFVFG